MHKKVFQLIVENSSGVLSRISGLFSRRGYNIESITAGVTSDPGFTRITIVTSGDEDILEQIEKQVAKLIDVRSVTELRPEDSVYRELLMIKLRVKRDERAAVVALTETDVFRANIIDVGPDSMIIELTGTQSKVDDFIALVDCYEILEIARTGIAGLTRGTEKIVRIESDK
ncbi:MAG TPA: acetolactate synthase small subunit [Lachnospiraceae bacterium]|nr:acetolactate synthase small subunit [Lachnospiraceae bacterium]